MNEVHWVSTAARKKSLGGCIFLSTLTSSRTHILPLWPQRCAYGPRWTNQCSSSASFDLESGSVPARRAWIQSWCSLDSPVRGESPLVKTGNQSHLKKSKDKIVGFLTLVIETLMTIEYIYFVKPKMNNNHCFWTIQTFSMGKNKTNML